MNNFVNFNNFPLHKHSIFHKIQQMNKRIATLLLIFTIPVWAKFSATIWSGTRYDSNICSLSDYDLTRFADSRKDFLLKTSDDGIFRIGGSARYNILVKKFKFYFGASVWGAVYYKNSAKNYIAGSAYFKVKRDGTNLKISAGGTPEYHTRAYNDDETETTQWSSYESGWFSAELSKRIIPYYYANLSYKFTSSRYNDFFPEYDSDRNEFEFSISHGGTNDIELGYRFSSSDARGYDQADETKQNSDESDISYEQDLAYIDIGRDISILKKNAKISMLVQFAHRVYTSQKNYFVDPLHLGRSEIIVRFEPSAKYYFAQNYWLKILGSYRIRRAKSEYNPEIPKLRDYDRAIFEISVGRNF